LYRLIERTILAQTEDQYPFATVYDQELVFYCFRQEMMSNPQYYEKFNTKVHVSALIGVTRQHKVLLDFVAQELHSNNFDSLAAPDQLLVRADAEERYLSYVLLRQSGPQHSVLKTDLQNRFTTGDNNYPKDRPQCLYLLDKFSKSVVPKPTPSEGMSFVQKGGEGKGGREESKSKDYDKTWWKDKECFKCQKIGHPATTARPSKRSKMMTTDLFQAAAAAAAARKAC
jgi:hypothetical protein